MKAKDQKVIEILNDVLTAELTAINEYFVHAEMCDNWGYDRLHDTVRKHAVDEMRHAEMLIERILFLEGVPNVQRLAKIAIGEQVPEQLKVDLKLENAAVSRLNDGIRSCRDLGDVGTAELLEDILESEEKHVNWLEAQLELIEQAGEQNYLAQQIRKDDEK
jgi:bacterioferritin